MNGSKVEKVTHGCETLGALQDASLFFQASCEERLGIAELAYILCGIPFIASRKSGNEHVLVNRITDWMVDQTSYFNQDFANQIYSGLYSLTRGYARQTRFLTDGSFSSKAVPLCLEVIYVEVTCKKQG